VKKSGILNPDLAYGLAKLGHKQWLYIVDCGTPLPPEVPVVDLSLVFGVPSFPQVLDAILAEIVIEASVRAAEATDHPVAGWIAERGLQPDLISHEELKSRIRNASLVIRTGEASPYANIGLRCGVPF
jgi:D-ribose pyranase